MSSLESKSNNRRPLLNNFSVNLDQDLSNSQIRLSSDTEEEVLQSMNSFRCSIIEQDSLKHSYMLNQSEDYLQARYTGHRFLLMRDALMKDGESVSILNHTRQPSNFIELSLFSEQSQGPEHSLTSDESQIPPLTKQKANTAPELMFQDNFADLKIFVKLVMLELKVKALPMLPMQRRLRESLEPRKSSAQKRRKLFKASKSLDLQNLDLKT